MAFVLGTDREPLDPCHPARARQLLRAGRAAVFRRYPFTIILNDRTAAESVTHAHRVKINPGSRASGLVVVQEETDRLVWAAELAHRGEQIRKRLLARRMVRRARRFRKTRYRKARFLNRRRSAEWLPPSLVSRVQNIMTWVDRLRRTAPVAAVSVALHRFDTQKLQNPEIEGVEYQRGDLFGYEVWEYLLEKWGRRCAYCGAQNVPLEKDHIIPKSRGGTDRVSNLAVCCRSCNQAKANRTAEEFGHPDVQARAKKPMREAAAVNSTRWALYRRLLATGLAVEAGTGGQIRYNRTRLGLPKAHWTDAACVGASTPAQLRMRGVIPMAIRAAGHGNRQMCGTDRYGFPIRHRSREKRHFGYQTGDMVLAVVPSGTKSGRYTGRVLTRASGSFDIRTAAGRVTGVSYRYCRPLHLSDGYQYA